MATATDTRSSRRSRASHPALGDWGRLVRDPLDLLRLALLAGAFVTLAVGPREQSFRLLLTFLLVLVPRALDAPRPFDLGFIAAMSFQAWGNVFGAFDTVYGYDKIVHFLLPCSTSALAYLALVRLRVVPDFEAERGLHQRTGIVLLTGAFGLTLGGGLYEIYEWFADSVLGAHLYVSYGDSIGDLTDDMFGALAGGALILLWDALGGASRRFARPPLHADEDPVANLGERVVERFTPEPDAPHARKPAPPLPRWLVAEWPGPIRDPLDMVRLSFAIGAIVALAVGRYELAVRFVLTFAAAVFVRRLRPPRPFDLAFLVAMAVQAWGALARAFSTVGGYGAGVHLVVSAAAAAILYIALIRLRLVPDLSRRKRLHERAGIGLIGFCFGFGAGVFYELYVFLANHLLGAHFRIDYGLFIGRLGLDAAGALAGALLLVAWDSAGWATRRLPAEAFRARAGR